MARQDTAAHRHCASCRGDVEDGGLLCPRCHRETARRKIDLLDLISRRPESSVQELAAATGLTPLDIVNIAGDGRSRWRPAAGESVTVCVVCALPTNSGSVCRPCTRRLEGRSAFA